MKDIFTHVLTRTKTTTISRPRHQRKNENEIPDMRIPVRGWNLTSGRSRLRPRRSCLRSLITNTNRQRQRLPTSRPRPSPSSDDYWPLNPLALPAEEDPPEGASDECSHELEEAVPASPQAKPHCLVLQAQCVYIFAGKTGHYFQGVSGLLVMTNKSWLKYFAFFPLQYCLTCSFSFMNISPIGAWLIFIVTTIRMYKRLRGMFGKNNWTLCPGWTPAQGAFAVVFSVIIVIKLPRLLKSSG